jgi:hypothetical protein
VRSPTPAIDFLHRLERHDLAALLEPALVEITESPDGVFGVEHTTVVLHAPEPFAEALGRLAPADKARIAEALCATDPTLAGERPDTVPLRVASSGEPVTDPTKTLLPELVSHRAMLIAVATGGPSINQVNDYYKVRQRRLSEALGDRGLTPPVDYPDLWAWFEDYKSRFPRYHERREYITARFAPVIAAVIARPQPVVPPREATGWERVDRALAKARQRLESSAHVEDFQTVGLLCREVLISVAQAVYDAARHVAPDGVVPSPTDAQRMLEAFFGAEVAGPSNEAVRKHAKAALALALDLQHRRTATWRHAALCLEASESTVNVVAILSGGRERRP